ncbi:MAG: TlpA disulfide reductase family protein [Pedobacter sp.]
MRYITPVVSLAILLISCNNNTTREPIVKIDIVVQTKLETIKEATPFTEFNSFWNYYSKNIKLNEDFLATDNNYKRVSKTKFLNLLSTGKFQPILINPSDTIRYQLKRAPKKSDKYISEYMKQFATEQLVFFNMEGQQVPKFDFTTLTGAHYTNENTKGKIILMKCWFISCVPCVKEMPQLNDLVESYKNRNDIIFLSLAIDDKKHLKRFLEKTRFDYETVAEQEGYMSKQLNVSSYPTHILVNAKGQVVKITNEADDVEKFFKRMLKMSTDLAVPTPELSDVNPRR